MDFDALCQSEVKGGNHSSAWGLSARGVEEESANSSFWADSVSQSVSQLHRDEWHIRFW